ncbi:MAG: tetratricopeptide repeat protein [Flavobacteriales bacterium]|nr:tetratricopeptide repeat protein [Flavobacteriales bacterium]
MSEAALHKDRFEAIEAFLLGTMSPEARYRFEQELLADVALRGEVELQRENTLAVELAGITRTLQAARGEHHGTGPASGGGNWTTYLKYAAMVAVLILGAVWWSTRPTENERLFAEYYVEDPGLPVPMSAVNDPVFQDAMVAYKLGDYAEARTKWGNLLQAVPGNDTLRFYIANAYVAEGDAKAAIPLFQAVADAPSSAFHDKARWYLVLAYLHEGRLNELPDTILENDPVYGERVRAIRSRIHS